MLRSRGMLSLVLFLGGTFLSATLAAPPLVIFGDSLSDQGNRAQQFENANFNFPAFYYKSSRWSNGPVWNDYFDESMTEATDPAVEKRVVANYAFGSSQACRAADGIDGIPAAPKLSAQIETFLSGQPPLRLNNAPSSGPWEDLGGAGPIDFAIAIGSNDFFARLLALRDPSFDDVVELLTDFEDDVIKCVVSGVEQLLSGLPRGQQSTMMVAGLTKISGVPALSESLVKEGLGVVIENAREDYNLKLQDELGKMSVRDNTTLVYLDLSSMEDDAKQRARIDEAPLQPVEQLEGRCLETDFPGNKRNPTSNINPDNLDTCDDHFFYDKAHPTEPVHRFFGQQIAAAFANPKDNRYTSSAAHGFHHFFSLIALLSSIGIACLVVGV
ncbi:hypothetical protein DUNSADRAFT_13650 [Dunaliella salina]|uniref:Uncharacterized protein n=1 Tax=Dunaliella salina TaxID=3046 RepID=A0ABQ7G8Y9_DUNSA|nr:hypothetical protein DUNSADRAFT_13650 [Dunaliella salina]|eukprot:KAF5831063.1 hypothetical protein DUNSADRAFT_13650 [Dunaliella salina]